MKTAKPKPGSHGKIDSRAAVASARSIQKSIDGTYDEAIAKSPFCIQPAREFLDSSPDLDAKEGDEELDEE
jgi:hypothetical protein